MGDGRGYGRRECVGGHGGKSVGEGCHKEATRKRVSRSRQSSGNYKAWEWVVPGLQVASTRPESGE